MILLASDYDGTLKVNNLVTIQDKAAIQNFRANGNLFGLITGRSLGMIRYEIELEQLELDFIICNNGGVAYNESYKVIFREDIDSRIFHQILAKYKSRSSVIGASDGNRFSVFKSIDVPKRENFNEILDPQLISSEKLLENEIFNSMFIVGKNNDTTLEIMNEIEEEFGRYISCHFNNGTLDINARTVSKEKGVQTISKHFNADKIIVVGDGYNDISMIREFNGYVMSWAPDEVKKASNKFVNSVSEVIELNLE